MTTHLQPEQEDGLSRRGLVRALAAGAAAASIATPSSAQQTVLAEATSEPAAVDVALILALLAAFVSVAFVKGAARSEVDGPVEMDRV